MIPAKLLVAAALCLAPTAAFALGQEGHAAIAEVASHRLSANALKVVDRLLKVGVSQPNGASLASIASWADDWRAGHKDTSNWHFVDIPLGSDNTVIDPTIKYDAARDCPPDTDSYGTCLLAELPKQEDILKDPKKTDDERAQALWFVVHIVGDLSQPLHCVDHYAKLPVAGQKKPDDDQGGNTLIVTFNVARPAPDGSTYRDLTSFHTIWDTDLLLYKYYSWGSIAHDLETTVIPALSADSMKASTPEEWANECHTEGQDAYSGLPAGFKLKNDIGHATILDQAYFDKYEPIAMQQLAVGALHLAQILNTDLASGT